MVSRRWCLWRAIVVVLGSVVAVGCTTFGPHVLGQMRLHYNDVIKRTTEEQLLLNIVRLRYTDTPSSLAVADIAAQFVTVQVVKTGITPPLATSGRFWGAEMERLHHARRLHAQP